MNARSLSRAVSARFALAPCMGAALCMAVSACGDDPVATEREVIQLLANGDVEAGASAPDGWQHGSPEPGAYEFEWTGDEAGSGARSLTIRRSSAADPNVFAYWFQSVDVTEVTDRMFELSALVRVEAMSGGGAAIAIRGDDTSAGNGSAEVFWTTQALHVITGSTGWQRFRVGLTAVPGTVDLITVYLIHLSNSTGTVFFDDVRLEVVTNTSNGAEAYFSTALGLMENQSINRYVINWPEFRDLAMRDLAGARLTPDTWRPIRLALERLGDNHSFLWLPPPTQQGASAPPAGPPTSPEGPPIPLSGPPTSPAGPPTPLAAPPGLPAPPARADPSANLLDAEIGYVEIPAFSGGGAEALALATEIQGLIESVDTLGTCGWVVDLRGNTGGNMWPMIAGVGPVVGEGTLGFFVDPDGEADSWGYEGGASILNGNWVVKVSEPYTLESPDPPVAVLTDRLTASSGEATTIAFRARPGTRSFGEATWGVSTANQSFPLADGAVMVLTVATMADRTGQLYGQKIFPDEAVEGDKTQDPATDAPLSAAIDWLQAQPACAG